MTYNIPLMQQVYNLITANPELHNQYTYEESAEAEACIYSRPVEECHTTHCIAGWAIMLSHPHAENLDDACRTYMANNDTDAYSDKDYEVIGAELMGLEPWESTALFYTLDNATAIRDLKFMIDNGYSGYDEGEEYCDCYACLDGKHAA